MKSTIKANKIFPSLKKIALLVILGVALHLLLPQITNLEHSVLVLRTLIPWAVGLAIISQFISYLGSGYLLSKVLALSKQFVKLLRSTIIVLGSASIGMIAGGMIGSSAAIFRWTSKSNNHPEGAFMASILPSLINDLVLVVVSMFGLIHLLIVHKLSKTQLIGFISIILLLVFVIGLGIMSLRNREKAIAIGIKISTSIMHIIHKPIDITSYRKIFQDLFTSWDT